MDLNVSNPISSLAGLAQSILDRVLPDKAANDAAKMELAKMSLSGELSQMQAQLEINKVEAANASVFVAGWRPAFGWVGAAGLTYQMVARPLITVALSRWNIVAPSIEIQDLLALVGTMLGFGAMRSFDKSKSTDSGH